MSMGKEQERRLMELLGKLAAREAGAQPIADLTGLMDGVLGFGGQEHTDAITLNHMGWIRHRMPYQDVTNSWSSEGIYAFDLTEDGRAAWELWNSSTEVGANSKGISPQQRDHSLVMVIHGSQDGNVPQVVDAIRLWCFEQGLAAYKAIDIPNSGRFVNDKVGSAIDEADYYVVVLTADEELANGVFRARPNTMMEMARVLDRKSELVCVLKENKVDMPSDYRGLITEPLDDWRLVLQRELKKVGLL